MLYTVLVIVQVVIALVLIGLILIQHGKGADAGAAFGSGASGTVFGAKGSANFMTHATAGLATLFFAISLTLAYLVNGASTQSGSVTDRVEQQAPAPSALSDSNNNGVAGDELVTGDTGSRSKTKPAPDSADNGNNSANGGEQNKQSSDSAGGDAGGVGTGAQIPD